MTTSARRHALRWFRDHEQDPTLVLLRRKPSTRMCRLMAKEGQLARTDVGQFKFARWQLTSQGHAALTRLGKTEKDRGASLSR